MRTAYRVVAVPYEIPRRCAAMYFPEANVLVPIGSVALKSNTPTSAVVVTLSASRVENELKENAMEVSSARP